jgi:methionyl-tRNA formyltransferase
VRIALISRVDIAVAGIGAMLRALGHDVVGVVTSPLEGDRYGAESLGAIALEAATGLDVLVAGHPSRIAPLLAVLDADVAISAAFPLRIPADALEVPPLGIINTHPALLPRYRGPNPIAWAVRNGDPELGYTVHRMDADFDTGAILAQGAMPLADIERPEELFRAMIDLVGRLLPEALARVAAGDAGDPQPADGASYAGFFEASYAEIDWSHTADEVRRQILAWRVAAIRPGNHGALTTIAGARLRVLHARLDDARGGVPMQCADAPIWIVETEPAS